MVTGETATTKIHLSEISSLTFCTSQVYVSGYLMSELAKSKIPVVFSDEKCYPVAESLPMHGAHNCPQMLDQQLDWSLPAKKRLWQRIVRDKIRAQSEVLVLAGENKAAKMLESYVGDVRSGDTTNREAAAAARYFEALFGEGFNRDQESVLNAALNYGYSILLSRVCREIVSRGYLTRLGIFHRSKTNQWNLACDFMEPFRPLIDKAILLSGIEEFNTDMRRLLIDVMNRELAYRGGAYKAGSVVSLYVRDCFDSLSREIDVSDIEAFSLL